MPAPPPGLFDKVNYIIDFWVDPCHAPVIVYIELLRDPLADAVLTWFTFGLTDVLRGYVRPSKALGGTSFNRRGKEKKPKTKFSRAVNRLKNVAYEVPGVGDDLGNWIGKNLPGAHEIKGRSIGQGELLFWTIDDLAQRALLALLIADIAVDFLYEWATLVAETEYCKRQYADSLYATGPASNAGFPFVCLPVTGAVTVFAEGQVGYLGNQGTCGNGVHRAVSGITFTNPGPTPVQHYQRFEIIDADGARIEFSTAQIIGPGGSGESVGRITLNGIGAFSVVQCAVGGSVVGGTHDVAIWGSHAPT